MKIRLLKSMGIDGANTPAGTIVEVEPAFGRHQISLGRAEYAPGEEPEATPGGVISTAEGEEPFPQDEAPPEPPTRKGRGK